MKLISRFIPLRVSIEDENLGLNYTEHGESVGSAQLKKALDSQISSSISFAGPLDVASNDEHSELAASMNQLLQKHEQSRREIHLSERRFHNFAETASNWLWETDSNLNITFFNASNKGDRSLNVIGQPLLEVLNIEPPEDSVIQQCIAEREAMGTFEAQLQTGNKESPVVVEVRGVPYSNLQGGFSGYRGTITDITLRKVAENRATFLSMHDDLTGLMNRRALNSKLPQILADADKTGLSVVIAGIDLDGFKAVNLSLIHI